MQTGIPLIGINQRSSIGAAIFENSNYEISPETEVQSARTSEDGGFHSSANGFRKANVSFSGPYARSVNPFEAPLNIVDGALLVDVKFFTNGAGSPCWAFPLLRVIRVSHSGPLGQNHNVSITAESYKTFTYPTGNVD